ncbi:glutathione-disulfide reductase [Zooshikella ganghwensis]|uniref:Glutathione reductase n=1 Tax=Zooshikella ganghwensis TaxID=202772 RepID=A0A4P9VT13_9GAMM|nr:glutathione-disulfide reductase [Zooshikella ganghwensis]RDH46808.1 glutathione-disulfide reductase [Zooshikella ganghwensis]
MANSNYDYDLLVIGAGSGGVRASRMAASQGAKVAVVESTFLGGTCVNVGCVPKKLFSYAAHFAEDFHDARGFGWSIGEKDFDWSVLRQNKDKEIQRLNGIYQRLLENAGVTIINGQARFIDEHTVEVGDGHYSAERVLIATGGQPFVPEFPGHEHAITSNEAFYLDSLPKRAVVVGGGYIALEFASIFNGLGVETTLIYRRELFLRGFDDDVRHFMRDEIEKKGIQLRFSEDISRLDKQQDGTLQCQLKTGGEINTDLVLYATGRVPNTLGLNLAQVGVETDQQGAIVVNEHFQTSVPSIYALGDVINRVQLTPVALAEAMSLVRHWYQGSYEPLDYSLVPSAVFSHPNIASVGLTEAQARDRYSKLDIYRTSFRHLKHTLSGSDEKTLMKLIVDKVTDKVIGCHMVGAEAGEIMQGLAVAIQAGATKAVFDRTIGIHPTAAEEFVTMREPVVES